MCSDIVRTVRGFAQSLITGRIGLPITVPCPVGKKCTVYPAAAHSVTISAAAEDESMNQRPGAVGVSALSSTPSIRHLRPIFWILPSAFSSMVVRPPAMLPLVGCESTRSLVLWRVVDFWWRSKKNWDFFGTFYFFSRGPTECSPPVGSGVLPAPQGD